MIKMVCDRCGKDIKGTTYYTIHIYAEDINPKTEYRFSTDTVIQNLDMNTKILFDNVPQYCKECKDKIEAFIHNA